jgi:hypothetical protein
MQEPWKKKKSIKIRSFTNKKFCSTKTKLNWVWWFKPVIPALRGPRQGDWKFEASQGYIVRFCIIKMRKMFVIKASAKDFLCKIHIIHITQLQNSQMFWGNTSKIWMPVSTGQDLQPLSSSGKHILKHNELLAYNVKIVK